MRRGAALWWLRLAFLLVTVPALGIGLADRAPAAHLANNFEPDQCTWWVLHRLQETGAGEAADEIINWLKPRDANQWLDRARASGWSDGTEPRVGAITWWPVGDWGHVAYVEEVLDSGKVLVSEQDFPNYGDPPSDRELSVWDEVARGMRFIYPPVAQLEVTEGLVIDPVEVDVGESVTATFSLTNRGPIPAVLDRVVVSVRGPQPGESIVDFDFVADVVIQPQESYRFESSRSFAQPGTYRLNIWIEASGRGEIPKGEEPRTQVETTLEVVGSAAPQSSGPNQAPVAKLRICTVTDHCIAEHETLELATGSGTLRFYALAEDGPNVELSYDPDGDPLGFEWLINGPPVYSRSPDFELDSALLQPGENHVLLRVGDHHEAVTEVGATILVTEPTSGVRPVIVDPAQDAPTDEGLIVLSARAADGSFAIWTMNPQGSVLARLTETNAARYLAIEPSWTGSGVLYARVLAGTGQMGEIWLAPTDGSPERLVFASDEIYANAPAMSPDGEFIAFAGRNAGRVQPHDLFVVNADGTNQRRLTDHPEDFKVRFVSWSPDGTRLAYSVRPQGLDPMRDSLGNQQVYVYDFAADETTLVGPYIADTAWIDPAWSLDGSRLLVAELNEQKRRLLLVDPATGESREIATWSHNVRWTTSEVGPDLESPVWSPDGRFIAFVFDGQIHIMAAGGGSLFVVPGLESLNVRHAIDWR